MYHNFELLDFLLILFFFSKVALYMLSVTCLEVELQLTIVYGYLDSFAVLSH